MCPLPLLWYEFDTVTACAIFYIVKFHVVCTCTIFGDNICLLTNRKMIKIVTLIDLHIVLTNISKYDCWHCFLIFNIWVSHALEIGFYYPTLELFCFSFTQPFTHSKLFCLANPFLFGESILLFVYAVVVLLVLACFQVTEWIPFRNLYWLYIMYFILKTKYPLSQGWIYRGCALAPLGQQGCKGGAKNQFQKYGTISKVFPFLKSNWRS
jgi:hypothetical protein